MSGDRTSNLVKIVYFDEESASDLLDIAAGGKESVSKEQTRDRALELEASAGAKAAAKFNWLPFVGGSAEAGASASTSVLGHSILNKTLSNTILTDYLSKLEVMPAVARLNGLKVSASEGSAAYMKMFTPYMALLKMDDLPVNLAALDQALEAAKGYYELLGQDANAQKCILRFNIDAFRNNYGLTDLGRMDLLFHGIRVGGAPESSLSMQEEMSPTTVDAAPSVRELRGKDPQTKPVLLDVYDVILAGVDLHG